MGGAWPQRARWLTAGAAIGAALLLSIFAGRIWAAADEAWFPTLVLCVAASGAVSLALAWASTRPESAATDKVSQDVDAVSERLLRIERQIEKVLLLPQPGPTPLGDIVEDIGSLSRVVKDLAETAAGHERAIAVLGTTIKSGQIDGDGEPGGYFDEEPEAAAEPDLVPFFFPAREFLTEPPHAETPRTPSAPASFVNIMEALEAERVDLLVQAIVSLPQRRPVLYDCFPLLRPASGEPLVPAEFAPSLERLGQAPRFDALVVDRALAVARGLAAPGRVTPLACTLSRDTLADGRFLAFLDRALADVPPLEGRLVLVSTQRAWGSARPDIIDRCRQAGIAFALTEIEDFALEPELLTRRGVQYVKLPTSVLLDAETGNARANGAAELPPMLAQRGVEVIADGVDGEEIIPELIDLEVGLAQGYSLALPSPIATIFGAPDAGGAKTPGPAPDPGPGPGPDKPPLGRPLRDFLRRAG